MRDRDTTTPSEVSGATLPTAVGLAWTLAARGQYYRLVQVASSDQTRPSCEINFTSAAGSGLADGYPHLSGPGVSPRQLVVTNLQEVAALLNPAARGTLLPLFVDALDRVLYVRYGVHVKEDTVRIGYRSDNGEPYLRFKAADGKYKKVCLKALAKRLERELAHGGSAASPIMWDAAINDFLDRCSRGTENRNKRPKSHADQWREESVLRRLAARFRGRPVHAATARDLGAYVNERSRECPPGRGRPYAPATVGREVAVITRFFGFMEDEGHVAVNPARRLKQSPSNERSNMAPSLTELKSWRERIPADCQHVLDFFDIAVNTGMRAGEIVSLKPEQYCPPDQKLYLPHTKAGKPQVVPVNPCVRPIIERRVAGGGVWMFPRPDGNHYTVDQMRVVLMKACDHARLARKYWVHDIRRAFATWVYRAAGLLEAQALLRHSSSEVTKRYIAVPDESLRKTVDRLSDEWNGEQSGNISDGPSVTR